MTTTLYGRIAELIQCHGSLREVSRVIGVDAGYLSRLGLGEKDRPSKAVLDKLGLRRVVTYERKKNAAPADPHSEASASSPEREINPKGIEG